MDAPPRAPADVALAQTLSVLASPNRLALLRLLTRPSILAELRLPPENEPGGPGGERAIARQAVRVHLRKLIEANVVVMRETTRRFGETAEYLVNPARLFAISEEFRGLASLQPEPGPPEHATLADARTPLPASAFPRLLLVRGLTEGRSFPLVPPPGARDARWIIGRRAGVSVRLDYDPYVSLENTSVTWRPGEYQVETLAGSRNGTLLNLRKLHGDPVGLEHGDVLSVGRTSFVFHSRDPNTRLEG